MPHELALQELRRCADKQFDPKVVEAFVLAIEEFRSDKIAQGMAVPF